MIIGVSNIPFWKNILNPLILLLFELFLIINAVVLIGFPCWLNPPDTLLYEELSSVRGIYFSTFPQLDCLVYMLL